jgi:prepilin-type N-terminal cleavage/methylation domain-containing protein
VKGMKRQHRSKGFTLLELLVVMAVLAAIIAVMVSIFSNTGKSKYEATALRMINEGRQIAHSAEVYYITNEANPQASDDLSSYLVPDYLKTYPTDDWTVNPVLDCQIAGDASKHDICIVSTDITSSDLCSAVRNLKNYGELFKIVSKTDHSSEISDCSSVSSTQPAVITYLVFTDKGS